MIFSTSLLSQFIDISRIDINDIYETLNDIGMEVEHLEALKVPSKVVVGKVISKTPHPNADKLNVCQVDIGNEVLQIVCGAKNVEKNQFVALALEGAKLPKKSINDDESREFIEIKTTTLRGVASCGMICSASELGLVKNNDGIMILDESIGELVLGKELSEYAFFNQYLIDVSLTPNRGDCFSILGLARELAAAYNLFIKKPKEEEYGLVFGVGRVLSLHIKGHIDSLLLYKVIESSPKKTPLMLELILAYNGLLGTNALENYKNFATYMSGVLFNIYPLSPDIQTPTSLSIEKDELGFESVYDANGNKLSIIGVKHCMSEYPPNNNSTLFILEANYIHPESIAKLLFTHKIASDKQITYSSTRGSNPELLVGMNILCSLLHKYAQCSIYSGHQEIEMINKNEYVNMTFNSIVERIGKQVDKEEIALILKRLNFKIDADGDGVFFRVTPPIYRHDIHTPQDVTEEFLRMYRIKNIPSIPYQSAQKRGINQSFITYQHTRNLATRAIAQGFYETIHYVFYEAQKLIEFGYPTLKKELDLKNPITNELNTLRTSLIPPLFNAVVRNENLGFKHIKMFEIGSVFDSNRVESKHIAFIVSGLKTSESYPTPKGEKWDFYSFAKAVSSVIGEFSLEAIKDNEHTNTQSNSKKSKQQTESNIHIPFCAHPYQCARIIQNGKPIGIIAKFNSAFSSKYDINEAFFAEINNIELPLIPKAESFVKLHSNERDLTILISKDITFMRIRELLLDEKIPYLSRVFPLDVYEGTKEGEIALTIRFIFTPQKRSFSEEELAKYMQDALHLLESNFNASIKDK